MEETSYRQVDGRQGDPPNDPQAGWVVISKKDVHTIIDTVVGSMIGTSTEQVLPCSVRDEKHSYITTPGVTNSINSDIDESEQSNGHNKLSNGDICVGDDNETRTEITSLRQTICDYSHPSENEMTESQKPYSSSYAKSTGPTTPTSDTNQSNVSSVGESRRGFKWKSSLLLRVTTEGEEGESGGNNSAGVIS